MILIDCELGLLALSFLIFFSPIYAWGMLKWFNSHEDRPLVKDGKLQKPPYRFSWSIASVIGIASVVSMTYVFVWQLRGIPTPLQPVLDLAIVFLSALPAMIAVDQKLKKNLIDRFNALKREIDNLYIILKAYEAHFDRLKSKAEKMARIKEVDKGENN